MIESYLAVIGGLILLTWSADRFVSGAAGLARILGAPPLLIGITIVGLGTSAPEILVSLSASLNGTPNLAVGNAVGSNITNIALVLGLTALISPLAVSSGILRREWPLLLIVSAVAIAFCANLQLSRLEGGALMLGFCAVFAWMLHLGRSGRSDDPILAEITAHESETLMPAKRAWFWVAVGLVLLPTSAQILVHGATQIAHQYGVSDLVIGLTIVAIGTSLPELAASLAAALRNEADMALGNILGSNLFNLLLVLGLPGLLAAPQLEPELLSRDLPMMLGLTLVAFIMAMGWRGPGRIARWEGAALLVAFVSYELILAASANLI
jgi:cation:H+ antiporter